METAGDAGLDDWTGMYRDVLCAYRYGLAIRFEGYYYERKSPEYVLSLLPNGTMNKYAFYDIDRNGIKELVIAWINSDNILDLIGIWTLENGKPRCIADAYWSDININTEGYIVRDAYLDTWSGAYVIGEGGYSLHELFLVEKEYIDGRTIYKRKDSDGIREISENEYNKALDGYIFMKTDEFEWDSFFE
jgi:hypothetical protein